MINVFSCFVTFYLFVSCAILSFVSCCVMMYFVVAFVMSCSSKLYSVELNHFVLSGSIMFSVGNFVVKNAFVIVFFFINPNGNQVRNSIEYK